jgi:hypothetical protein
MIPRSSSNASGVSKFLIVSIGRNEQKFVEMVIPSKWQRKLLIKAMNDQLGVLT